MVLPILISVSVAPGVVFLLRQAAERPQRRRRAHCRAAAQRSCDRDEYFMCVSSMFEGCRFSLPDARSGGDSRDKAGGAGRHEIDDQDQDDAVDRRRPAPCETALRRCWARTGRTAPPKSAPGIEPTPPTTSPTSKAIDSTKVKLSGATNCDRDRAERAGDAGIERAHAESQRLVERGIDPHRARRRSDDRGSPSSRGRCGCSPDCRREQNITSATARVK